MLKFVLGSILLIISLMAFTYSAKAEEIHFDSDLFILKYSGLSHVNKGYENEYFLKNEARNNWTKMVGIYYYPEVDNPIKFAESISKKVETSDIDVLLKFIKNKKTVQAALSYLENGSLNGKTYFEYNIYKYEKHPTKGIMSLRYAVRYFFDNDEQISAIGKKVREQNDEYLEKIVTSPMPLLVEKDINQN